MPTVILSLVIKIMSSWVPIKVRCTAYKINRPIYIGCPTRYRIGWLADHCFLSQQLGALPTHTTDTFLFISHTTNVLLFKFLCNIFIGFRIIKEMPGSVASGTHCIKIILTVYYNIPNSQLTNTRGENSRSWRGRSKSAMKYSFSYRWLITT